MKFILNPTDFIDWQGLYKLLGDCFAYMDGVIDPPSSLHKLTPDDLRIKAQKEVLLLIFDVEELVGCAYFDIRKEAIYLGKIAVKSSHQGQGLANQIIDYAINLARQNSKQMLELETRIELTDNHKTFAKLGFTTTAHNSHTGFDRPTSITMVRKITTS